MDELERRLERLERENRRLKRVGAVAALGLLALVLTAQAWPLAVQRVGGLIVQEPRGEQVVARLGVTDTGGRVLVLHDGEDYPATALGISPSGQSQLRLDGPAGTGVQLRDRAGRVRARLELDDRGEPALVFLDEEGRQRWRSP